MLIKIGNQQIFDREQGVNTLAFCHYPVTVAVETSEGTKTATFNSFDEAREWLNANCPEK